MGEEEIDLKNKLIHILKEQLQQEKEKYSKKLIDFQKEREQYEKELEQEKEKNKKIKRNYSKLLLEENVISKDKIEKFKEFYINEHRNKGITLIPLENLMENINILLEE